MLRPLERFHSVVETGKPPRLASARKRAHRRRRAFSFIELLLVLLILVVMASLAAPRYVVALDEYRAEHAARRIAADLAATQATARAAAAAQSITFDAAGNSYQLTAAVAGNSPTTVALRDAPFNVDVASAAFAATGQTQTSTTLTFNGFGVATAGGSITVRAGGVSRTVSVEQGTGAATIK